jgi:hypothetical protein
MAENKSSGIGAKSLILLIIMAITVSVVVTLLQTLILGKSNVAVTGGIVGAFCVGLWMSIRKKKADAEP